MTTLVSTHTLYNQMFDGSQVEQELVMVTPALAEEWLKLNFKKNRNLDLKLALEMAQDIREGNWRITNAGVAFGLDGLLYDGQHRLQAVILAETPVPMWVARGLTLEACLVLDQGKKRDCASNVNMAGYRHSITANHVAVMRAMVGSMKTRSARFTTSQSIKMFDLYYDAVEFSMKALPTTPKISTAEVRAVIARAYFSEDHGKLFEFGESLALGQYVKGDSNSPALLARFLYDRPADTRNKIERYAKTTRALQLFIEGRQVRTLFAAKTDPFDIPQIDADPTDGHDRPD